MADPTDSSGSSFSNSNVPIEVAASGFGALGSEARLQVLLMLVRAGYDGLSVGDIQERSGIAPSTLQHHLKMLAGADLIRQQKAGRVVRSYAEFTRLEALAGYILNECCADAAAGTLEVAGPVEEKPAQRGEVA